MRALTLLAAMAMIHATHALPRQDLAVRQGGDDLSNDSHVFHHMDRNQRTANRDRNHTHVDNAEGSGLHFVKRLPDRPQERTGWQTRARARARVVNRRFMQSPDYSQGGSEGGSSSASPAPDTMPTQQPPVKAANSHGRF